MLTRVAKGTFEGAVRPKQNQGSVAATVMGYSGRRRPQHYDDGCEGLPDEGDGPRLDLVVRK